MTIEVEDSSDFKKQMLMEIGDWINYQDNKTSQLLTDADISQFTIHELKTALEIPYRLYKKILSEIDNNAIKLQLEAIFKQDMLDRLAKLSVESYKLYILLESFYFAALILTLVELRSHVFLFPYLTVAFTYAVYHYNKIARRVMSRNQKRIVRLQPSVVLADRRKLINAILSDPPEELKAVLSNAKARGILLEMINDRG